MKKIVLFSTIALLVVIGYFFYQKKILTARRIVVQQPVISAYLKITDQSNFVKYSIAPGKSALDLTKEGAAIITKGGGANAYITGINGQVALDSKKEYWAFYINGKLADVGAGSYILKGGDKIEWKIEKY